MTNYREIEVRFLEIDKEALVALLSELGARDEGETILEEIICYDKNGKWLENGNEFVKLRKKSDIVYLTYKNQANTVDGTEELEVIVSNMHTAELLLERLGYPAYRHQQKLRHTFVLDGVTIDIDTWPHIPSYVELEGDSEEVLKEVAQKLRFDWADAVTDNPRKVIEERYNIPVGHMKWFTFERFE